MKKRVYRTARGAVEVKAEKTETRLAAAVTGDGGEAVELAGSWIATGAHSGLWRVEDGSRHDVAAAKERNGTVWVAVDGRVFRFESLSEDDAGAAAVAENMIAAPMPGKVTKVFVAEGDSVEEGAPVLIVEAMKMEHTLRAPKTGTITNFTCAEGDQVEANVPLVEIE
ncbi:MAG: 2-oxoglutarate carboxylase large subunit [Calditrichaeota bacterium]|nr:2-oxoglutarate carboxylase large subunit [Calditrichota bacterium]